MAAWQILSDRALVEALRSARAEAVDEFIRRFEPLVARYAQLLRVPPAERSHWAGEVLYDVALTISRARSEPPRHLGAYVAGACKLRVREQRTREAAYRVGVQDAIDEVDGAGESAVVGLCSESSLRSARGPEWELPPLSPVLERLVSAFEEGITDEEHTLLRWRAGQISYTMIAEWLGISRPAAVSRIQRLRARLIESALRFGTTLDHVDRREFLRFLRRTGAVREERILVLENATAEMERRRNRGGSKEDPR